MKLKLAEFASIALQSWNLQIVTNQQTSELFRMPGVEKDADE